MNTHSFHPVIVIVAFNRVHTLKRLLSSLDRALIPPETRLIISIDNNGTNQDVVAVADEYVWKHGEKEVIHQATRLGLRVHVIASGDFSYQYGSFILLEDDLVVSPYFYKFTVEAFEFYNSDKEICGISLYNLPYTEASKLPFLPLDDHSDVYFQQVPCSLGIAMTANQWDGFKKWFLTNPELNTINGLPMIAWKYWSASSWKKYLYGFMVVKNLFFIYPRVSLTSNFNDRGENMYEKSHLGQVSLQMVDKDYKFKSLKDAISVYDAYSEILPDRLKKLCPELREYDFEIDLYGQKESFSKEFVITSKHCNKIIKGYERTMKPAELNLIFNIPGVELSLAKKEDVVYSLDSVNEIIFRTKPIDEFINDFHYYYINIFDNKKLIKILIFRLLNKFRKTLKSS
jgi:hypothetical protein